MNPDLQKVLNQFEANRAHVRALNSFDQIILDFVLGRLDNVRTVQEHLGTTLDPRQDIRGVYRAITDIRDHGSLRSNYEHMYTQSLVLLVSYFSASTRDLFVAGTALGLGVGVDRKALWDAELKLTAHQAYCEPSELPAVIAGGIIEKDQISFQDMKSMGKAFETYCGFKPERDVHVDNIILGQACRHAIVHDGARVDERLVKQLKSAANRSVKQSLEAGELLTFSPSEVDAIGNSMTVYLEGVAAGIDAGLEESWP